MNCLDFFAQVDVLLFEAIGELSELLELTGIVDGKCQLQGDVLV